MGIKTGNVIQSKFGTIARTTTTATVIFELPPQAMPIGLRAFGTNSDASTSATITVSTQPLNSTSATTLGTVNAKATGAGATQATLAGAAYTRQSNAVLVKAVYAEAGDASSNGGPYTVAVDFV